MTDDRYYNIKRMQSAEAAMNETMDAFAVNPPRIAPIAESAAADSRGAPKAVQFLLPVWGQRYVKQFLEYLPADDAGARQPSGGGSGRCPASSCF